MASMPSIFWRRYILFFFIVFEIDSGESSMNAHFTFVLQQHCKRFLNIHLTFIDFFQYSGVASLLSSSREIRLWWQRTCKECCGLGLLFLRSRFRSACLE